MSTVRDLRRLNESREVADALSTLVYEGRSNYKTIIEKTKPTPRFISCGNILQGTENLCNECKKRG